MGMYARLYTRSTTQIWLYAWGCTHDRKHAAQHRYGYTHENARQIAYTAQQTRTQKRPPCREAGVHTHRGVSVGCIYVCSRRQLSKFTKSESVRRFSQDCTPVISMQWDTVEIREAPKNSRPGTTTMPSSGFTTGKGLAPAGIAVRMAVSVARRNCFIVSVVCLFIVARRQGAGQATLCHLAH
jgi:hypothetical protein